MQRVADEPLTNDTLIGIVTSDGEGRRRFIAIVRIVGALAVLAFVTALLRPLLFPPPLSVQAEKILRLPSDAKVVQVDKGRPRQVWFTLPEPAGKRGSRLDEVWMLNGLPAAPKPMSALTIRGKKVPLPPMSGPVKVRGLSYSVNFSEQDTRSLSFDPTTGRYHYETVP